MKAAQPVNGQTSTALGLNLRKVVVKQVVPERGVAICEDSMNYSTEVPYRLQRVGRMPAVGDVWYVDRSFGNWTFVAYVAPGDTDIVTLPSLIVTGDTTVTGGITVTGNVTIGGSAPFVDSAWTALTFNSGFQAGAFGFTPAYQQPTTSSVRLRGVVTPTGSAAFSNGAIPFTLPATLRPAHSVYAVLPAESSSAGFWVRAEIHSDGTVNLVWNIAGYTPHWVSLDPFFYDLS